jgi:phosphatidylserine/phosphatidylglycerophosphate/cardiolipin synthase-like enzyme
VKRGVEVTVLTGDTMRRTPRRTERYLLNLGVKVLRFDCDGLPMHAKFILAEPPKARWCAFGSYNLTLTSRWLNHELLVFSTDPHLWDSFDWRWQEIKAASH